MKFIEALREGERIQEVYLCRQKTSAMTKTGKEYENVILQDKTGSLDAKIWGRVQWELMILMHLIMLR